MIFCCDHASNRFPARFGHLGLDTRYLEDHIVWDIGAGAVTRHLQQRFGADAVLANYSRLVVDLNRHPRDRSSMPAISDGILIPGNLSLSEAEHDARCRTLHTPYHAAIEDLIATRTRAGHGPVFIGIHSFTPRFHGTERPWHVGVLYDRDPRLAIPLLAALRQVDALEVGDNEPYSGRHTADYSIDTHAESRGLAHVGIEIRQDLIADRDGQQRFATLIGDALAAILTDETLYEPLSPVNPLP